MKVTLCKRLRIADTSRDHVRFCTRHVVIRRPEPVAEDIGAEMAVRPLFAGSAFAWANPDRYRSGRFRAEPVPSLDRASLIGVQVWRLHLTFAPGPASVDSGGVERILDMGGVVFLDHFN